jgi:hypothetical protein
LTSGGAGADEDGAVLHLVLMDVRVEIDEGHLLARHVIGERLIFATIEGAPHHQALWTAGRPARREASFAIHGHDRDTRGHEAAACIGVEQPLTFPRENSAPVVVKTFNVPALSRFNVAVSGPGSDVPELAEESFGARIDATRPIVVERSVYSNANGVTWAAGTNATATPIP